MCLGVFLKLPIEPPQEGQETGTIIGLISHMQAWKLSGVQSPARGHGARQWQKRVQDQAPMFCAVLPVKTTESLALPGIGILGIYLLAQRRHSINSVNTLGLREARWTLNHQALVVTLINVPVAFCTVWASCGD